MENLEEKQIKDIRKRIEARKQSAISRFGEVKDTDSDYWKRRKSGKSGREKIKKAQAIYNDDENRAERRNFKKLWRSVFEGRKLRYYTTKKSKKRSK